MALRGSLACIVKRPCGFCAKRVGILSSSDVFWSRTAKVLKRQEYGPRGSLPQLLLLLLWCPPSCTRARCERWSKAVG